MPLPRPFRRRSAPAGSPLDPATPPTPGEGLRTAAAEAAETAAEADAAAWVEEPADGTQLDPPGWFRDEPLTDAHEPHVAGAAVASAAVARAHVAESAGVASPADAPLTPIAEDGASAPVMAADPAEDAPAVAAADVTPAPVTAADEPAGSSPGDAESAPAAGERGELAPAEVVPAAAPPIPDEAITPTEPAAAEGAEATDGETADAEPEAGLDSEPDAEPDAVLLPGTIYRTDPVAPADAAIPRRRRSPIVSVLVGLLILAVVGVGGFGVGMLLPLLIPLPSGDASVVSPVPSVPTSSASPAGSATAGGSPAASPSAAPSPSVRPSPAATPLIYVVERGDQLGRIAASFGVTLQAIEAANNITNPNLIIPGQKLVIPSPSPSPVASPSG